jgi:hypothetical protein
MSDTPRASSRIQASEPSGPRGGGVEGNVRLTGAAGALIFVLLAIEGVTILRAHSLLPAHVFVGMFLVPVVALRTGTTVYRFAGPVVIASIVAVFATGIAALALGPSTRWILQAQKASFIAWFG